MKEITTTPSALPALSPAKQTAIQLWKTQPTQCYSMLRVATPRKMIEADTPNLWELRGSIGHPATIAILVKAFIHAAKLVNLDKNLTEAQIGEAANDVLEQFGYLKVEEVKYVLKRSLRNENIYGRLDYNVLMNWFELYDAERTEEAVRISEQQEAQALRAEAGGTAMSLPEYIETLKKRAETDEDAAALLRTFTDMASRPAAVSKDEQKAKDHEFKKWRTFEYLIAKKK